MRKDSLVLETLAERKEAGVTPASMKCFTGQHRGGGGVTAHSLLGTCCFNSLQRHMIQK